MSRYEVLEQVVPGVTLVRFRRSRFIYSRTYLKTLRTYRNKSTSEESLEGARAWVLEHLQELFSEVPKPRGGGSSSVSRLLSSFLHHQEERTQAGEITEGTLVYYQKTTRHFQRWFPSRGFKRLGDISRTSLQTYARDRVNNDGMAPNTANGEVVYLRAWWKWLQETEVLERPLTVPKLRSALEHRTGGEPFAEGDLRRIHKATKQWVEGDTPVGMFNRSVSDYNKQVFALFLKLLEESGARQHELLLLKWSDVKVGETRTDRRRVINTVRVPHHTKRGYRVQVFRGESLLDLRQLQKKMCPEVANTDYVFRNHQTNTPIDRSTFSRYWSKVQGIAEVSYPLHTYRAYRITELILGGVEVELVARNLGLSVSQIMKTYLRFVPAARYDRLVQPDKKRDGELREIISAQ